MPSAVDIGGGCDLEREFLRHLVEAGAAGQGVVDAVGDVGHAVARLVARDLELQLVLDLVERPGLARLDAADAQDMPAEAALDRRRRRVVRRRERRVGKLGREIGALHPAEIERLRIVHLRHVLGDGGEILAALKLRRGGLGGCLVGQQHLQHLALLGRVEFVLVLVVGGFELIVADRDPGGDVVEPQHRHLEAAPLGRLEGIGMRAIYSSSCASVGCGMAPAAEGGTVAMSATRRSARRR